MRTFILIMGAYFIFYAFALYAQCPDRLLLLNRINQLKASTVPRPQQLNELLPFVNQLEKCAQKNDSVNAFLLQRVGALYYLEHNFNNAVFFTKRSIDVINEKDNTYSNIPFLIKVYTYLGIFYDSLLRVKDKMNAIDSCIHYALKTNAVNDDVLFALWQRVSYSFDIGDYQRCVNFAAIGEALTEKYSSGADSLIYISNFFGNRINALIELKEYEKAESDLLKKISAYKIRNEENKCGPFYNQLATVSVQKQMFGQALAHLQNSFRCYKKSHYMLGCKQSLNNIGCFYIGKLNDPGTAISYFNKALRYSGDIEQERDLDIAESSNVTGNIADAYAFAGKFDSSFIFFQKSFDLIEKGADENTLLETPIDEFIRNPKIQYVMGLIREKGDACFKKYMVTNDAASLEEAIRIYKVADKVLTKIRFSQSELQSKLAWRSNARSLYEHAIKACHAGNKMDDAFYFFERSRAVLLNEQINENRRMANADILKQAELNNRLAALNNQLESKSSVVYERTEIQKSILTLTQEKDLILSHVRANEYLYSGMYYDSSFLSLNDFTRRLRMDKGALLELFSGDSAIYMMLITKNNAKLSAIDKIKYDSLTGSFAAFVSDPVLLNQDFGGFINTSNALYKLLFNDMVLPEGNIIVSPGESYFPFEALVTIIQNGKPSYLIEERPVSYTYSARYLLLNFGEPAEAESSLLLGMAPVEYPSGSNLAALPGSDNSLNKLISNFRSSHSILNSAATKSEFLNQFYRYKIVQLYTHASERGKSGEPVIYFSDSALYVSDLLPVKQPATRLVILSACETAKGKFYQGEGVFSFNRAFAEAGVPSSMVNLWSVDNQSTYLLTELFYKNLSRGMPFDESLQKAKVEFLKSGDKEKSLPYYWAATILAGQAGSVKEAEGFPWSSLAAVIIFLSVFFLFIKKYYTIRTSIYSDN